MFTDLHAWNGFIYGIILIPFLFVETLWNRNKTMLLKLISLILKTPIHSINVKENPSDGMSVAHLIMKAKTMADVENIYADFHRNLYKGTKEGQCYVEAARRIRQLRSEGVRGIIWDRSSETEKLIEKFGREAYREVVNNLLLQYPLKGMDLYD